MPGVVLATHGGASAVGATRIAAAVAQRLGVELSVAGVVPLLQPMDYAYGMIYVRDEAERAAIAGELGQAVREQLALCGLSHITPTIRMGNAAHEIASCARELHADLIVVGLGPHHALDRAMGGETALQLVQVASTPVLAAPADAATLPERALAAIDFTPTSIQAAQLATRLLHGGDALHLVHARTASERVAVRAADGVTRATTGEAEVKLSDLVAQLRGPHEVSVDCIVLDGPPARTLLDELARFRGDLIALGSHGYGLWKRLTIGSVASKVLRHATTCVLVKPIGSLTAPVTVAVPHAP
jgi:nucleotide-binding universal stress UspA family protein